jgi:plasmid stabilization system protein ParE
MPTYELSPEALNDLQVIQDFISIDNIEAAERLIDEFFETFEQLAAWPKTGHMRTDLTPKDEHSAGIQIVAVLHGWRDVPTVLQAR